MTKIVIRRGYGEKSGLFPSSELDRILLKVESIGVNYTTERATIRAVDGVSFVVHRGEALGLAGESGSGKSTIAQTILRLLPANAGIEQGRIAFEGREILSMHEEEFRTQFRWKRISTVPQAAMNALTPVHRINRQIAEAITTHEGATLEQAILRAGSLLESVGISKDRGQSFPHQFSGGMKQRAVMAMALACDPGLLIADEPTTGLDVISQAEVLELLKELKRRRGLSLIFITHDLSILPDVCDKIAIMYAGKIVEQAESEVLFNSPAHPYTKALLASFPDIENSKERLTTIPDSEIPVQKIQTGCKFHPRCRLRIPKCIEQDPEVHKVKEGHFALCHLV